jgi:hypothetical protein
MCLSHHTPTEMHTWFGHFLFLRVRLVAAIDELKDDGSEVNTRYILLQTDSVSSNGLVV